MMINVSLKYEFTFGNYIILSKGNINKYVLLKKMLRDPRISVRKIRQKFNAASLQIK